MSKQLNDRSAAVVARAGAVIPGGVNSWRRRTDLPISPARAHGARIWDVDGREYLDFHGAYGAIVLGHSFPAVTQAVASRIADLVLVGIGTTPDEVELAERLVCHLPSAEQALVVESGSAATFNAIRLSRAVTGRECVVRFGGSFHGAHDYALRSTRPLNADAPDGVLEAAARTVITCRYNDLPQVQEVFRNHGANIAAIIVEPIAHNANLMPDAGFLGGLRSVADKYGCLLIFDEVITGFRTALGGYQSISGVTPDLTTCAKAMGNGYPIAALVGRQRYMRHFATDPAGSVPFSGTYNGNAVGVTAANATLAVIEQEPVHHTLYRLGERMRSGLEQVARECDVPAVVTGHGPIYNLLFTDTQPRSWDDLATADATLFLAYRNELLARGILEMPLPFMRAQVTYSHTDADIDRALETAEQALAAARDHVASRRHSR